MVRAAGRQRIADDTGFSLAGTRPRPSGTPRARRLTVDYSVRVVTLRSPKKGEDRRLSIGLIGGEYWVAI